MSHNYLSVLQNLLVADVYKSDNTKVQTSKGLEL